VDDWLAEDRDAFRHALARSNAEGLRIWMVAAIALAVALVLVALGLAPIHMGVPYGPAVILVAVAVAGLVLTHLRPERALGHTGALSAALVVGSALVLAWTLVTAPTSAALVAGALVLVSVGGGLLFSWELPLALAVQGGLLAAWALGLSTGPGWQADMGQAVAATVLVAGGAATALLAQQARLHREGDRFQQLQELERAARAVGAERLREAEGARERDRLFSDVTNGLREPVVRLLRAVRDQLDAAASASAVAAGGGGSGRGGACGLDRTWSQGLRLLRKIDDVGTLALHQRGHLRLRMRRIRLGEELERFTGQVAPRLEAAGLGLDLFVGEVPEDLHVDTERLERVLAVVLAELLRRCPEGADIQVEIGTDGGVGGTGMARVELWCEAAEEPVDRASLDDFWREPQGESIELRLARALVEFQGGRLIPPLAGATSLSWVLLLRTGTQHLTDRVIDRRMRDGAQDNGRRILDRSGMAWAAELATTEEYRFLEVFVMAEALSAETEAEDAAGARDEE